MGSQTCLLQAGIWTQQAKHKTDMGYHNDIYAKQTKLAGYNIDNLQR